MFAYALRRIIYTAPVLFGVALVCFALVHLAPGDPLISILPADASVELQERMLVLYGFDRSYAEQFFLWLGRALQGDLGTSIATGRAVTTEVMRAVGNTLMLATVATLIGFILGCFFGFVAGYFSNSAAWTRPPRLRRCSACPCRITGWAWCWSSSFRRSWAGCPRRARGRADQASGSSIWNI
jgi:ABC-type dipeptide/oligopeptide/nickel transport system permease component